MASFSVKLLISKGKIGFNLEKIYSKGFSPPIASNGSIAPQKKVRKFKSLGKVTVATPISDYRNFAKIKEFLIICK